LLGESKGISRRKSVQINTETALEDLEKDDVLAIYSKLDKNIDSEAPIHALGQRRKSEVVNIEKNIDFYNTLPENFLRLQANSTDNNKGNKKSIYNMSTGKKLKQSKVNELQNCIRSARYVMIPSKKSDSISSNKNNMLPPLKTDNVLKETDTINRNIKKGTNFASSLNRPLSPYDDRKMMNKN